MLLFQRRRQDISEYVLSPMLWDGNPALQAPKIYNMWRQRQVLCINMQTGNFLARVKRHRSYVSCMYFVCILCDVLFLTFFISVFLLPFSGHLTFVFVERTSFFFLFLFLKKVFIGILLAIVDYKMCNNFE